MKFFATLITITFSCLGFSQGIESKTKKENLIVSYAGLTISGELNDSIIMKTSCLKIINDSTGNYQIFSYEFGSCCSSVMKTFTITDNFIPMIAREFAVFCKQEKFFISNITIRDSESGETYTLLNSIQINSKK